MLYAKTDLSYDAYFLHIDRLQQKQLLAGGISKILVKRGTESFLLVADFHVHE